MRLGAFGNERMINERGGRRSMNGVRYLRVELPGNFELRDIAGVDLLQRRVSHCAGIVTKTRPVCLRRAAYRESQTSKHEPARPMSTHHSHLLPNLPVHFFALAVE